MSGVYFASLESEKRALGAMSPRDNLSAEIERNLRLVYETSFAQDVPERFAQLLARLRAQEHLS